MYVLIKKLSYKISIHNIKIKRKKGDEKRNIVISVYFVLFQYKLILNNFLNN